ncbi:GxxExxY protein [Candidatus Microgenomates bacterium]|nr:MAG: GxxExxY protein [Candidatus Microgenomates bacterium]
MDADVKKAVQTIKDCAQVVFKELGSGWQEVIYQKAMEVELRHRGLMYETQRILPITFNSHVIGESIPDLVVWVKTKGKKTAIVCDLKADSGIKEEHGVQVSRYIKELKKQMHAGETVFDHGLLINFFKEATSKKLQDGFEDLNGVQVLEV